MAVTYNHHEVEKKWQKYWDENNIYILACRYHYGDT